MWYNIFRWDMNKGMTIIEVLISVVVAGVVFAGVLQGIRLASNIARHTIYTTGAINVAQEKVEKIKNALSESLEDSIARYDGKEEDVAIYSGSTARTNDDVNGTQSVDIIWRDADGEEVDDPLDAAFAEVRVNVSWDVLPGAFVETVDVITNVSLHN